MPMSRAAYSCPISLNSDHLIAAELASKLFAVALHNDHGVFEQVARREIVAVLDAVTVDAASRSIASTAEPTNPSSHMLAGDIVRAISMATPRNPRWEAHARVVIATMLCSIRGNVKQAGCGIEAPDARLVASPQAA
jgi:hypothetical protein